MVRLVSIGMKGLVQRLALHCQQKQELGEQEDADAPPGIPSVAESFLCPILQRTLTSAQNTQPDKAFFRKPLADLQIRHPPANGFKKAKAPQFAGAI